MKNKQHNWLLLTIVALFYGAMTCTVMFKIPSITDSIIALFKTDAQSASLLMSIFTLVSCILAFPCAYFIKKLGSKQTVLFGTAVAVAGSIIGAISIFAKDAAFLVLLLSRGLEGVCYIFASICIPVLIKNSVPAKNSGLALSIFTLFIPLGSLFANTYTPGIMSALGFSWTWVVYSVALAVSAVLLAVFFVSDKNTNEEKQLPKEPSKNPGSAFSITMFMISFGLFCFMQIAILNYFPARLSYVLQIDMGTAGFFGTFPSVLAFGFSILFGHLSDRQNTFKKVYIFALSMFLPGIFMIFAYDGIALVIGYTFCCVGLAAPAVNTVATFELFSKKNAPFGIALSMAVCCIFQSAGSAVCQAMLGNDFSGWFSLSLLLAAMGVVAIICAAFCKGNKSKRW